MKNLIFPTLVAICFFCLNSFAQTVAPSPDLWKEVKCPDPKNPAVMRITNINGLALAESATGGMAFLAVVDLRDPVETPAIVLITFDKDGKSICETLNRPNIVPAKLEAVTSIPGDKTRFLAITEMGVTHEIQYNKNIKSVSVRQLFKVPLIPAGANFEALAVQNVGKETIIAWADRGEDKPQTKLFWAKLNITAKTAANITTNEYSIVEGVEFTEVISPQPEVSKRRHIADLKIDSCGGVFIVGASDPGDYASTPGNPNHFDSYFYSPGLLRMRADKKTFGFLKFAANPALMQFYDKKIEGLEFLPNGGIAFATDNEASGAEFLVRP